MSVLSTSDLLEVWERGSGMHPLDRGLLILAMRALDLAPATIADWSLGRRNQALLSAYVAEFGSNLRGWRKCSRCGEKMEFNIDPRALSAQYDSVVDGEVHFKGRTFRLPTSRDLASIVGEEDLDAAASAIARVCLIEPEPLDGWELHDVEALGEAMATADPMAELRVSLKCPTCDDESEETIDIVHFLWSEIEVRAKRALWEVHTIASAYAWSEREILQLSPVRRARYLELVHA